MGMLQNMRVYVRVAELGNLSAAGRNLRMSAAMVSHRIQQLETHLGVRLLNRTTRKVNMTEQGQAFYERCLEALRAVEAAENSVAEVGGTPQGKLRITAPVHFGRQILAPLIPAFRARHPKIQIQLSLTDRLADLIHEGVDVAIRMAVLQDSSLIARQIADCHRVLCAAPAYLDARGTPAAPEDLHDHNCLMLRFPGSQQFQWTLETAQEQIRLPVAGDMDADDGDTLTAWALAGQGIVLKPLWEVAPHIASGALRTILDDAPPPPAALAVLYPHRRLLPAKVRTFADFVVERGAAAIAAALEDLET